ncbi:hypothetical protein GLOTRDRAFT_141288 [Gloeophyllum trabeum ATCC 11539]|uniref:Uncharacterized protein n=1 Tax=Gloeophyllum trabeum (strain ATCC 11539 / FP-39264 / Madison 617) TaxID=670483 RepID=S7PTV8_GLOTA|nr:uncharacterized protein GLOTRDRAFT_141288 [Gloeophyllum trabeum ATCC 11539]EPQ50772.1 hypothetical protein GLOTRDRAFT_141288 [Gloeophyllum trabeum ATCC 11539]
MDTTRPPPPRGNPPPYAFVNRVYRSSLRPVVIVIGLLSGIWTLVQYVSLFREVNVDKGQGFPKLGVFAIALGALYLVVALIEFFGVGAAALQKAALVRIYSWLSVASALIIVAGGFLLVIVHFVFKNDIITECVNLSKGDEVIIRNGIWGPFSKTQLSEQDAQKFCNNAWSHDSWGDIIALIIEIVLAALFCSVAFAFYRQLIDPTSPANTSRAPSNQYRAAGAGYPQHYNPPYNGSMPDLAYNAPYGQYAPPPGPPPNAPPYDTHGPPGYGVGMGDSKVELGPEKDVKDDPFADFDGPSLSTRRTGSPEGERDVTSRPRPGERETFNV